MNVPAAMKRSRPGPACVGPGAQATERGSAIMVVLILVAVMSVIVVSNGVALRHLKQEIKLVEQRQKRNLESTNSIPKISQPSSTNSPAHIPLAPKGAIQPR
jgi:hypothetical protein